jgi:hypothetical protein
MGNFEKTLDDRISPGSTQSKQHNNGILLPSGRAIPQEAYQDGNGRCFNDGSDALL